MTDQRPKHAGRRLVGKANNLPGFNILQIQIICAESRGTYRQSWRRRSIFFAFSPDSLWIPLHKDSIQALEGCSGGYWRLGRLKLLKLLSRFPEPGIQLLSA